MPAEAKEMSLKGAAAFARHYFELIEYTSVTNNAGPIREASKSSCIACQENLVEPANYNKKTGGWNAGGAYHPTIAAAQFSGSQGALVSFRYEQDKRYIYKGVDDVDSVLPKTSKPVIGSFKVAWNGHWTMQSIDLVAP